MIAYRLYRAGKHVAKVRKGREWLPVATGVTDEQNREIQIPIGEVGKYVNRFFWEAMELYGNTELLGAPFGGGWAEWPWEIFIILRTLKAEAQRWEYQEYKQRHGGQKHP
jgi:hypothetical protein